MSRRTGQCPEPQSESEYTVKPPLNIPFILLLSSVSLAQVSQASLAEQFAAKLESPFIQNADWIRDYDEARARAKETGKPIFAYFSRSFLP